MIELLFHIFHFFVSQIVLGYGILFFLLSLIGIFISSMIFVVGALMYIKGYGSTGTVIGFHERKYTRTKRSGKKKKKVERRLAVEYLSREGEIKRALTSD